MSSTTSRMSALHHQLDEIERSTNNLIRGRQRALQDGQDRLQTLQAQIKLLEEDIKKLREENLFSARQIENLGVQNTVLHHEVLGAEAQNRMLLLRAEAAEAQNAGLLLRAEAAEARALELTEGVLSLLKTLKVSIANRINKVSTQVYSEQELRQMNFPLSAHLSELKNKFVELDDAITTLGQNPSANEISAIFRRLLASQDIRKSHTGIKRIFNFKSNTYKQIEQRASVFFGHISPNQQNQQNQNEVIREPV